MLIKKILSIAAGILIALIFIFCFAFFVKGVTALMLIGEGVQILFNGFKVDVIFPFSKNFSFITYFVIIVSPLVVSFVLIELALIAFRKVTDDYIKSGILALVVINTGFVIFSVIYGALSILLPGSFVTEWQQLFKVTATAYNQSLILMLFILFLTFSYMNIVGKRLRKNLPAVIKTKEAKNEPDKK